MQIGFIALCRLGEVGVPIHKKSSNETVTAFRYFFMMLVFIQKPKCDHK